MTPERLAEILASIDRGDTWDRTTMDLAREVHRLRALPVIATCGECGHCVNDPQRHDPWCWHGAGASAEHAARQATKRDEPPPTWCPLRGGAR